MKNKVFIILIILIILVVGGYFFFYSEKEIFKEPPKLLLEVAKIGDYVEYEAGTWDVTKEIPTSKDKYTLGGYEASSSRNDGIVCDSSDTAKSGWRIINIGDENITLISAGVTECFYLGYSSSGAKKSIEILTKEQYNDYVDENYAISVSFLTKEMVDKYIEKDTSYQKIADDLIAIDQEYWLASSANPYSLWYVTRKGVVANYHVGVKGVRPIITLDKDVRTKGQNKKNVWILAKEEKSIEK